MNIFSKIKFLWQKPKVIIVTGNGRQTAREAIYQVLNQYFQAGKEVLIFETDLRNRKEFEFLIRNSVLPVLVITQVGDIPPDKDFFAGEREKTTEIRKLAKILPPQGFLILNFDDETVREIKEETNLKDYNPPTTLPPRRAPITFGFQEGADFRVTDIKLNPVRDYQDLIEKQREQISNGVNSGTNFKINYRGNIVPFWLEKLFGKEQIYSALAATAVGTIFDLNLVEISQALKNYQGLPGKMRLIKGIKNSWILDNSDSATVFSMIEALEILGKLQDFKRKTAVLGDIIGIGKYTIEAHEAIGERVAKNTDLLFAFGPRAKFIAQGAIQKGMALEKIFQFDTIEEGKIPLQNEIKEGDLILVSGSKEIKMGKIVEEIKAV